MQRAIRPAGGPRGFDSGRVAQARARRWQSAAGCCRRTLFGSRATSVVSAAGAVRRTPAARGRRLRWAPADRRRRVTPRFIRRRTRRRRQSCSRAADAVRRRQAARDSRTAGELFTAPPTMRCSRRASRSRRTPIAWAIGSRARPSLTSVRADILSDATPIGSIQVPASGQPILLMADRQTTGGYPKIATVISADLPLAGQLAPGDWIEFHASARARRPSTRSRQRMTPLGRDDVRPARAAADGRIVGAGRVARDAPLAPFTTFKVGGPADWLVQARERRGKCRALEAARAVALPVTRARRRIERPHRRRRACAASSSGCTAATCESLDAHTDSGRRPASRSTASCAGRSTSGVAGLEAWAGTPGTVGGAIYGNAHFRGGSIGELVEQRRRWSTERGRWHEVAGGGAWSSATTTAGCSARGRSSSPRCSASAAATRRRCAPSRGSRWRSASGRSRSNPPAPAASSRTRIRRAIVVPDGIPAVRRRAGRSRRPEGKPRTGAARVSPTHGNFIVNEGGASAADIRALIERCKQQVRERFGVELREEIVYLGFGGEACKDPHGYPEDRRRPRACRDAIAVEGNKNSALPLLAACLLTDQECVLTNVPRIRDVEVLIDLLDGARRRRSQGSGTSTAADHVRARSARDRPDPALVGRLRGSVLLLGPLLARRGSARLAPPGGDFPARRTIATHLQALIGDGAGGRSPTEPGHALEAPDGLHGRVVLSRRGVGDRHRDGAAGRGRGERDRRRSATPRWSRTSSSCASSCGRWASRSRARGRRRSASRRRRGSAARRTGSTATTSRRGAGASSPRSPAASIEVTGARWTDIEVVAAPLKKMGLECSWDDERFVVRAVVA